MKVSMVMVVSLDGKTTRGTLPGTNSWASAEDQAFFKRLIAESDSVIMGSRTYDAARSVIRPSAERPRVILTRSPERYSEEAKLPELEFTADELMDVLQRVRDNGRESVLVVGGADTNSRFLDAGLIDEIYISIEPLLFGAGLPLTSGLHENVNLRLLNHEKLNEQGTLLLHYEVIKR